MGIVVQKFGGSSVATTEKIKKKFAITLLKNLRKEMM